MPRYAAFLRGINVGGHRVAKGELGACFERIGLTDVTTFRASGNVIFGVDGGASAAKLSGRIEHQLESSLGYAVPTFLRSESQMRAIAEHRPFPAKLLAASDGKLQALLLRRKPSAAERRKVLALASDEDRLAFEASELYWLPSGRMRDSALDLDAVGAVLGLNTMRTKGTLDQIAAKYFAD